MQKWKTLSSKFAFDHKWFKVRQDTVQLPDGKILDDYFLWYATDVAMIVPVTPNQEFILVQQYKHGAGELMIEFPAGFIEKTELPEQAASRELQEETGHSSPNISLVSKFFHSPSKSTGSTYVFVAPNVQSTHQTSFDENEDIKHIIKPYQHVIAMIRTGEICASDTIAAALLACKHLNLPI